MLFHLQYSIAVAEKTRGVLSHPVMQALSAISGNSYVLFSSATLYHTLYSCYSGQFNHVFYSSGAAFLQAPTRSMGNCMFSKISIKVYVFIIVYALI